MQASLDFMPCKYSSLTPYNFSYNNPTNHNDPSGADPGGGGVWFQTGSVQYPGYTYDDKEIPRQREFICAMCWRDGDGMSRYGRMTGYGTGGMGAGWKPSGSGGWIVQIGNLRIDYNALEDGSHFFGFSGGGVTSYRPPDTGINLVIFHATAREVRDRKGKILQAKDVHKKRFEGTGWEFEIAQDDKHLLKVLETYKEKNLRNLVIVSHGSRHYQIPSIVLDKVISVTDFSGRSAEDKTDSDAVLFSRIVNSVDDGGSVVFIACNAGNGNFGFIASSYAAAQAPDRQINVYFNADNTSLTYKYLEGSVYYDIQFGVPLTPISERGWIETGTLNGHGINPIPIHNIILDPRGYVIPIPKW